MTHVREIEEAKVRQWEASKRLEAEVREATSGRIYIGYLRVSTDDKEQDPERQKILLEAYASGHGHRVVAWVTDEGTSAGKRGPPTMDRPSVKEALRLAQQHHANGILVESVDRWTRKGPSDLGYCLFVLQRDHDGLELLFADIPNDPFIRDVIPPLMASLVRMDN